MECIWNDRHRLVQDHGKWTHDMGPWEPLEGWHGKCICCPSWVKTCEWFWLTTWEEPLSERNPQLWLSQLLRVCIPLPFSFWARGIEADWPNELSFGEHVKWALKYHDWWFRKHKTFPFVAFGIQQWQEALRSARIQMSRRNFEADANILSTITPAKLEQAQVEEEKKLPISDPAVRLLRKHVHATGGCVMGSDQSRY